MKTLVIYPDSKTNHDSAFYILDPETGECLATHLCSHSGYARSDLHDSRQKRLDEWKIKFGEDTEAKFIDETSYDWSEIFRKNQELALEKLEPEE